MVPGASGACGDGVWSLQSLWGWRPELVGVVAKAYISCRNCFQACRTCGGAAQSFFGCPPTLVELVEMFSGAFTACGNGAWSLQRYFLRHVKLVEMVSEGCEECARSLSE